MVSRPNKSTEYVVQEAKPWTWHRIYSEFSEQHLCRANSNCCPAQLGGRGLGYLCLTAHMQEIFLVPRYSFPPAASELCPVWFVSNYFDSTIYVFFTFPSRPARCVRSRLMYCTIPVCRDFLAGLHWRGITALSPFQFDEVNVIIFVTQDSCWRIQDIWTEWY
jgi:hypothetical protein